MLLNFFHHCIFHCAQMHNQPQLQPLLIWMSSAHIFYPPNSSIRLFSLSHKTLVSVECSFIVWCSHVPLVGLSHACICIVSSHALSSQTPPRLSSVCVFSSWPDYSLHAVNHELKHSHPFCVRASLVWYLEILAFLLGSSRHWSFIEVLIFTLA